MEVTNHATWDCKDKKMTCFNCGKQGLIGRDCPSAKKEIRNGGQSFQAN